MQKRSGWRWLWRTLGALLAVLVVGVVLLAADAHAADPYEVGEVVTTQVVNATVDADHVLAEPGELRMLGGSAGVPAIDILADGDATVYLYELSSSHVVVRRYGPFYLVDGIARDPVPSAAKVGLLQVTAMTTASRVFVTPRRTR